MFKKVESMQSKSAPYVLSQSRIGWSKTAGYERLNWLTVAQVAVEMSLRMFFRIIHNRKPEKIYQSLVSNHDGEIRKLSSEELANMTKLLRKSWRVRVLRYAASLPDSLYDMHPKSRSLKVGLQTWVKNNIPRDGDNIFKGRIKDNEGKEDDWLKVELQSWKERVEHDYLSSHKVEEILDNG